MRPGDPQTADEARDEAVEWSNWVGTTPLSWAEICEWSSHFERTGERFGLLAEFRENGVT